MIINETQLEKNAKKMQDEIAELRDRLNAFTVTTQSSDGHVQVKMDGNHRIKDISFTGESLPVTERLSANIMEAFNLAMDKADMELEKRMAAITHKYTIETIDKAGVDF